MAQSKNIKMQNTPVYSIVHYFLISIHLPDEYLWLDVYGLSSSGNIFPDTCDAHL